jgi:dTMP kinase
MFITFEGPDGSGKSTQVRLLVDHLCRQGFPVFQTREPGGTVIGDQIRAVLHDLKNAGMHAHTEILLYAASRAQLVAQEIRPRLAAGEIVICDRYADSTLAYQGYGRGLDLDTLRVILRFATGGLQPDLTLYLDIPAEEGLNAASVERRLVRNGTGSTPSRSTFTTACARATWRSSPKTPPAGSTFRAVGIARRFRSASARS